MSYAAAGHSLNLILLNVFFLNLSEVPFMYSKCNARDVILFCVYMILILISNKVIHLGHFTFWISPSLSETAVTDRFQGIIIVGIYMSLNILYYYCHRQQNIKFSRLHTDLDSPLGKCPQFSRA